MKPKDAARIFDSLPDDVLLPVAHDMKSDQLALVLASMNPDSAKTLTVKLANRLNLPQTADVAAPAAAPAPAAVVPTAAPPAGTKPSAAAPASAPGQNQATPKT